MTHPPHDLELPGSVQDHTSPIDTAVVGVGYFGSLHALCYSRLPGNRLRALVDPDPMTKSFADYLGVSWFSHLSDLPSSVRAVSVATPVATHYALAKALLQRGLDVLLEKPIAETAAQAAKLEVLADAKCCVLQIGHIERFNPAFAAGPALLSRAHTIQTIRTTHRKPRTGAVDVVIDLMIHDLDLILHGVASPVVEFHALGSSHHLTPIDEAEVELTFANGCRAFLRAHWGSAKRKEDRSMTAELGDNETWTIDFRRRITYRNFPTGLPRSDNTHNPSLPYSVPSTQQDSLSLQLTSFLDASRSRTVPLVTPGEGHAALFLAQQIRQRILDGA
jgi:predicted dehydrogenase